MINQIVCLKHGDKVTFDDGRFVRRGIIGTAGGYAVEYGEDPFKSIQQTTERKQLLYWVNQEAGVISGDPGYYEEQKRIWSEAIPLKNNQIVWLDGHLLIVKYVGNYSDMIHFEEPK